MKKQIGFQPKSASQSEGSTHTYTALTYFVPWKPVSPNQYLHKHWRVFHRITKDAAQKNSSALHSLQLGGVKLMTITMWLHSSLSGTPSPATSPLTTETVASDGNMDKSKPSPPKG